MPTHYLSIRRSHQATACVSRLQSFPDRAMKLWRRARRSVLHRVDRRRKVHFRDSCRGLVECVHQASSVPSDRALLPPHDPHAALKLCRARVNASPARTQPCALVRFHPPPTLISLSSHLRAPSLMYPGCHGNVALRDWRRKRQRA